jgi:hypothetical protein
MLPKKLKQKYEKRTPTIKIVKNLKIFFKF